MIIREFGVRQSRKALAAAGAAAAPLHRVCLRAALSTTATNQAPFPTTETTFADPSHPVSQPTSSSSSANAQLPSIFTSSARGAPPSSRRNSNKQQQNGSAAAPDTAVADFQRAQILKRQISRGVGTAVRTTYRPADVFLRPPGPEDVTLELLLASQAHMGHHASLWNPANARYIFGVRGGIHVLSLEQTAAHLRRAARVVEEVAYRAGLVLFVGTRPGQGQIVTQAARLARACHLFTKWTPGSITNSEVILAGMPMQVLDEHDEPVEGFGRHINERRPLVPDLVVCLNPLENYVLLHECALANVPTIGVIDTNAEPTWVTYAIPANDDSLRCLAVIGSVLGRAGEAGHKRRLEDAKKGIVTWETPLDIQQFMGMRRENAQREAAAEADRVNPDGGSGIGSGKGKGFVDPSAVEERADGGRRGGAGW